MPLTYDQNSQLKALLPVLDEHGEWLGRIMRQIFYPETNQNPDTLVAPVSFQSWVKAAMQNELIPEDTLTQLRRMHEDMSSVAGQMVYDSASAQYKPDIKKFDAFMTLYDEFVAHVRRIERDMAMTDSGFDLLTGLRSRQMLTKDLEKEMERRSRRGKPFCLALARIDHYAEMKANLPQADYEQIISAVGEIIKLCMRSFDDAYRLGNGEFLMCLKQADMTGGTAGLARLRKLLEEHAPYYTLNGQEVRLTMSSCVAEPQPGDDFESMMDNMRIDLDRFGGDAETALEYLEVSPLERFVNALDEESKKTH
jgi:diguanylate cyclase